MLQSSIALPIIIVATPIVLLVYCCRLHCPSGLLQLSIALSMVALANRTGLLAWCCRAGRAMHECAILFTQLCVLGRGRAAVPFTTTCISLSRLFVFFCCMPNV